MNIGTNIGVDTSSSAFISAASNKDPLSYDYWVSIQVEYVNEYEYRKIGKPSLDNQYPSKFNFRSTKRAVGCFTQLQF